jgi:Tfp pilus assembly protein PilF
MAKTIEVAKLTAVQEYSQAVAADPKNAEAHANLGWGFYGEGKWEEAIKEFSEALSLDAGQVDALYGLGLTRKAAGAKVDAAAAFDQAIALLEGLEDRTRRHMLTRLARGHINMLQSGHWQLSSAITGMH